MSYDKLDPILNPWAKMYGLFVSTKFKDDEARYVLIVDDVGECFYLWFGLPSKDDRVTFSIIEHEVSDQKIPKRRKEFSTTHADLNDALESAYKVVESWIHDRGHTRTPILP